MPNRAIRKSLSLESEPILRWPTASAVILRCKGYALSHTGMDGVTYSLCDKQTGVVEMIKWDSGNIVAWRDLFEEAQLRPTGLLRLARLNKEPTAQQICKWVSENGPLGFQCTGGRLTIPMYCNESLIPLLEPLNCIRAAARRAANVVALWSALTKSYSPSEGSESVRGIKSLISFITKDPLQLFPNTVVQYRVLVNGEPRCTWHIPRLASEWRELANALLAGYIQDHIARSVQIIPRVRKQNVDEERLDRLSDRPPDWNLRPALYVDSALAAYYLELLMVMRRFRSCKTCGKDISHQRDQSIYCAKPSTCRSKFWHREKARLRTIK